MWISQIIDLFFGIVIQQTNVRKVWLNFCNNFQHLKIVKHTFKKGNVVFKYKKFQFEIIEISMIRKKLPTK